MGVMANNGIEADKAANSLKTGLARLVAPAKEGAEKMAELGISVTNADGTMKDSITIQRELHDAFGQLSESEQIAAASAIFGKNQMAPWLALINTAPEDVSKLNESLETCAGTTDEIRAQFYPIRHILRHERNHISDILSVERGEFRNIVSLGGYQFCHRIRFVSGQFGCVFGLERGALDDNVRV